jgi:hypothetical protein
MPSSTLPPPFEWPTARMLARDRIFGYVLSLMLLAPMAVGLVALARATPEGREGPAFFLLLFASLPATVGFLVPMALDRRGRGLVFMAIRGGAGDAVVEVHSKSGVGRPLLLPLHSATTLPHIYAVGTKRMVVAELKTSTPAGEVLMARGGTELDRDLVRWVKAVFAANGAEETRPSPEAAPLDALAAAAERAPLDPPEGIEAFARRGWPVWRYRTSVGCEREVVLPWMVMAAFWILFMPMIGVASRAGLAWWIVPLELVLLYLLVLAGPATAEFEARGSMLICRRKHFGLTLWVGVSEAGMAGIDAVALPVAGLRFGSSTRGLTSPLAGGPDVAGLAWLAAAIRASSGPAA